MMRSPSRSAKAHQADVLIIGAGPAGLAMALALGRLGLACTVFEKQAEPFAADPADDGREIALTHRSVSLLRRLGLWDEIEKAPLGQIRTAHVLNKSTAAALSFAAAGTGKDRLSFMVPNRVIRKTLYDAARHEKNVTMSFGGAVTGLTLAAEGASVTLDNGQSWQARLVVAADSRYSRARSLAGIETDTRDFDRHMIVSRMAIEKPHEDCAYEWFQAERTLAILPLAGKMVSAVLTVPPEEAERCQNLSDADYAEMVAGWFNHRHGAMKPAGARTAYPLQAVYARRFHAPSFVLAGDAAVGMHPVTAHGFNFGLRAVETLSGLIADARRRGQDFASPALLAQYTRKHRVATRPLYLATNAIATLFTRKGPVSGLLRAGLHGLASKVPFARRIISQHLVDAGDI